MKTPAKIIGLTVVVIVSFLAGNWYSSRDSASKTSSSGRKILYYHDPMHPAYKSDKPGIAPDCGMQLEPVYADDTASSERPAEGIAQPPGTIQVSTNRQQLIGMKVARVEKAAQSLNIRVLGRVVPDESRIYRINAATDGWVRDVLPVTTGSLVKKDDLLSNIYAPDTASAMKAYLYGLRSIDRFEASGTETKEQLEMTDASIESYRNALRNLGMTDHQLDEIKRSRKAPNTIEIRATEAGFILARNITLGQRFERGAELYRISDLSHVWILADIFENEGEYFRPGATARIVNQLQRKSFQACVSHVLPQFDATTRTIKVRLEADNPGFALRPEMFVDVEFPVHLPEAITVPTSAVLDSGLKKTVFVDKSNGFYEPRSVETGWHYGDQVQIIGGLMPGERILVSGTFLVDSESRLRMTAARQPEEGIGSREPGIKIPSAGSRSDMAKDPACGMEVDIRASGTIKADYRGQAYYFCTPACRDNFMKEPGRYPGK